jgi:CRISPR-associated protein Cmr4
MQQLAFNRIIIIEIKIQGKAIMKKQIIYLLSRTPVHVGAGNSVGVVDSPIQRERHTKTPIIPGSSLKGVISDLWNGTDYKRTDDGKRLFGNDNSSESTAGELLIGEARVLAFPVRSAKGSFAWITSPLALQKFSRESGMVINTTQFDDLNADSCFAFGNNIFKDNAVLLEEYKFSVEGSSETIAAQLVNIFADDDVWKTVAKRLVIVNDEIFSYFVEHACEVVTRICIDDETGVVKGGALFNQEQVPSETMFYAVIATMKSAENLTALTEKIATVGNTLQVGGNATIGLGYCSVNFQEVK